MESIKFFQKFMGFNIPNTNRYNFFPLIFGIFFSHLSRGHIFSAFVDCKTYDIFFMFMVVILLLCPDIHLNAKASCGKENGFIVLSKSAHVSNFIQKVLISDTKNVFNREILTRKFIVFSGVAIFFKVSWLLNLTYILRGRRFFLAFDFLELRDDFLFDDFSEILVEKLLVFIFIRIVMPNDDRFFLSSNTYKVLIITFGFSGIEFHGCNSIGMTLILTENGVGNAWIIEQLDVGILITKHYNITIQSVSLATYDIGLSHAFCFKPSCLWTHESAVWFPFNLLFYSPVIICWFNVSWISFHVINVEFLILCVKSEVFSF